MNADEQLLESIKTSTGSSGAKNDDEEHYHTSSKANTNYSSDVNRILENNELRQQLQVGGAFTGPKGVVADYKFHQKQERIRIERELRARDEEISKSALKSGWMNREIEREEREKFGEHQEEEEGEENVDELIRALEDELEESNESTTAYKHTRLAELARLAHQHVQGYKKTFGTFDELATKDYASCIDNEDPDVMIVIHLYDPHHQACKTVNSIIENVIAKKYAGVKFRKIVSTKADADFDEVALPALLCYKEGELVATLLRITDEILGFTASGRCEFEDLEDYFLKNRIISEKDMSSSYENNEIVGRVNKIRVATLKEVTNEDDYE